MMRLLTRVQLAYLGLFLACSVAIFAYQAYYVWPAQKCDQQGRWWSAKYHMCATPMPIWKITGRMSKTMPNAPSPPIAR